MDTRTEICSPNVTSAPGGATPSHLTPDVWAGDLGMHPYWRIVLIEISGP